MRLRTRILAKARHGDYGSRREIVGRDESELPTQLASEVEVGQVRWLWESRLPLAKLTLLDGDPAVGKSTLAVEIAARLTTGRALPGDKENRHAIDVLLLAAEDDSADTLAPRLLAAGADRARVHIVASSCPIMFPDSAARLEQTILAERIGLVVVDPLAAFMRGTDGRAALGPLVAIAQRTGAAVLILRHLTKGGRGPAVYRGAGGIGISAVARSGLMVARDPDDMSCLVLASYKINVGERPTSLRFKIVKTESGCGRIEWLGEANYLADDLLAAKRSDDGASAGSKARHLLLALLEQHGGKVSAEFAKEQARRAGVATRTFERVARELVDTRREGFAGPVTWIARADSRNDEGAAPTSHHMAEPERPSSSGRAVPPEERYLRPSNKDVSTRCKRCGVNGTRLVGATITCSVCGNEIGKLPS